MIHGAHVIVYSKDAEADRAFFRDVLGYPFADAGHELYLMCGDVHALIETMKTKNVVCSPVEEQRWGSITRVTLPGGGAIGIYQPKHASPLPPAK